MNETKMKRLKAVKSLDVTDKYLQLVCFLLLYYQIDALSKILVNIRAYFVGFI